MLQSMWQGNFDCGPFIRHNLVVYNESRLPTSGKLLFLCHQPENCCSNCRGKMIYKFCNYTMYYLSNIEIGVCIR